MSSYTKEELETIITFNEAEKTASVYSCSPRYIEKMKKLAESEPDKVKLIKQDANGADFIVPKSWVKIRPPRKISDEQRQAAAERLKAYRDKQPN